MRLAIIPEHELQGLIEEAAERVLRRAHFRPPVEDRPRPEAKRWLSVRDASEYLGVSRSTLHRWRRKGLLEPQPIDGRVLYDRERVDAFASGSEGNQTEEA